MLSYVAHIPHSPLILSNISRHKSDDFEKMRNAYESIAHDIYSRNCDSIIMITPQGYGMNEAYTLNVSPSFNLDFTRFGDFRTSLDIKGDTTLAYHVRSNLCTKYPVTSITEPVLDTPCSTAMIQLQSPDNGYSLLPLTHSLKPIDKQFEFGESLRNVIEKVGNRVALLSLGDMSRTKNKTKKEGKIIDESIIDNISKNDTHSFLNHNSGKINSFSVCGYRPLAIVLGALKDMKYSTEILNYEQKHGVGMLATRFVF